MATSGTVTWRPELEEIITEAYERIGVDGAQIDAKMANSARRSLNLMFGEWSVRGINYWKTTETVLAMVTSQRVYTLPVGTVDILTAVMRRSGSDTAMTRLSMTDYNALPSKTSEGLPTQFFFDRQYTPQIYMWLVPENSTDEMIYWRLAQIEDVTKLFHTSDAPYRWTEAMAAGLSSRLAEKTTGVADAKILRLEAQSTAAFNYAATEEGEKAALKLIPV